MHIKLSGSRPNQFLEVERDGPDPVYPLAMSRRRNVRDPHLVVLN